ncbi:PE family protein [Mycolicibacterium llatzerense]|uniref:PE family protein n=1 Tax=Mycolicibacterium llatzerense TaxID=280871 RepID=UPI0008DDD1FD|nr:PE family protein [Mycolicibacterium llatzerense]
MSSPLILASAPVLAASAATEDAGTATMAGVTAGAAGPLAAVLPPGMDDASVAAAAAFIAHGTEATAIMSQLALVRGMFAQTIAANGVAYTATDVASAASLLV